MYYISYKRYHIPLSNNVVIRKFAQTILKIKIQKGFKEKQGVAEGCAEFGTLIYNCDRCSCIL